MRAISLLVSTMVAGAAGQLSQPAAVGRYTLTSSGIRAQVRRFETPSRRDADTAHQFIPYGATLTNRWVKDKSGKEVDVVLGYDDAAFYRTSHASLAGAGGG